MRSRECVCVRAPCASLLLTNRCCLGARFSRLTLQITGLEPGSAFLFKSALYPCVIEFTVKRDRDRERDTNSSGVTTKAAAVGTAVRTLSIDSASGTGSAAAAGGQGERGGEGGADGLGKDGNPTAAAGAGATGDVGVGGGDGASGAVEGVTSSPSSSSWLGHAKPKETSYKVGGDWVTGRSPAS